MNKKYEELNISTEGIEAMNSIKDEYEKIPVPAEALERMKKGIEMAKNSDEKIENKEKEDMKNAKEAKKQNIIKVIFRNTLVTAAAVMLAITVVANVGGEQVAYAMEKIPVIGAIVKVVTFKNYTDKTNNFEADVEVPQVQLSEIGVTDIVVEDEAESKTSAESAIVNEQVALTNEQIEAYAQKFIDDYEKEIAKSEGEGNYTLNSVYEVASETDECISLKIYTEVVMAGGAQYAKVFNIDKQTGELLDLSDFFEESSNYIDVITENIKTQMREKMAADEGVIYFIDSDIEGIDFEAVTNDVDFYFTKDKDLVVMFDEYEVAPGYMGAVEFTISTNEISTILK